MDNPLRMSTEKYKLKDFTTDEILLRIKNIVNVLFSNFIHSYFLNSSVKRIMRRSTIKKQ